MLFTIIVTFEQDVKKVIITQDVDKKCTIIQLFQR